MPRKKLPSHYKALNNSHLPDGFTFGGEADPTGGQARSAQGGKPWKTASKSQRMNMYWNHQKPKEDAARRARGTVNMRKWRQRQAAAGAAAGDATTPPVVQVGNVRDDVSLLSGSVGTISFTNSPSTGGLMIPNGNNNAIRALLPPSAARPQANPQHAGDVGPSVVAMVQAIGTQSQESASQMGSIVQNYMRYAFG